MSKHLLKRLERIEQQQSPAPTLIVWDDGSLASQSEIARVQSEAETSGAQLSIVSWLPNQD